MLITDPGENLKDASLELISGLSNYLLWTYEQHCSFCWHWIWVFQFIHQVNPNCFLQQPNVHAAEVASGSLIEKNLILEGPSSNRVPAKCASLLKNICKQKKFC